MFKYLFKNKKKLSDDDLDNFHRILFEIYSILSISKNLKQAEIVNNLIELKKNKKVDEFISLINGVDFWGGSGAVWEVYIEDESLLKKFELLIVALINFMEETKILGSGIKPIRKLFNNK